MYQTIENRSFIKLLENRLDSDELSRVRDNFHTWVFSNTERIAHAYQKLKKGTTNRTEEIHAPLRTFANLSGDKSIKESLEKALARQIIILGNINQTPTNLLTDITTKLIIQGYRSVTPTHIFLEMLLSLQGSETSTSPISGKTFSPEWVGRQMRTLNLVSASGQKTRKTINGHKLRILDIAPDAIKKVYVEKTPAKAGFTDTLCNKLLSVS